MPLDARDFTVHGQWAKNADTVVPPVPITGRAYRKVDMTQADAEAGQAYDVIWESSRNNQKDYEVSGIAMQTEKYGLPVWSPLTEYVTGSLCLGTDEIPYRAKQESGPDNPYGDGPVDPATSSKAADYWQTLAEYLGTGGAIGDYYPTPNTLALRNVIGCTQVNDPVEDLDAANKRWTLEVMGGGASLEIEKPSIISPAADAVLQTLGIDMQVTPLALVAGGTPNPDKTQVRLIPADDLNSIVAESDLPYTTTPYVNAPMPAKSYLVMVRHHDMEKGWSLWSDKVRVSIANTVQKTPNTVYPPRTATGVPFVNLTLELGPGGWTDDSTYAGSQSRFVVLAFNGATIHDSGWIPYATTYALPVALDRVTPYYWFGQHRAASAPASNPSALLDSPRALLSFFTTMNSAAPDMSGFVAHVPNAMANGTFTNVNFSGAVDSTGSAVHYIVDHIIGGLVFDKANDLADGEATRLTAPTTPSDRNCAFQVRAYNEYGDYSDPVTVNVLVVGQTVFVFQTVGATTFVLPASGQYELEVGGGGGGGVGYNNGAGGGGGYARKTVTITVPSLSVTVGAGGRYPDNGGTSSIGSILSATGGETGGTYGGWGGVGIGGDVNFTGGAGLRGGGGGGGAGDKSDGESADFVYGGSGGGGTTGKNGADGKASGTQLYGYGGKKGTGGGGGGSSSGLAWFSSGGNGSCVITFLGGLFPGE